MQLSYFLKFKVISKVVSYKWSVVNFEYMYCVLYIYFIFCFFIGSYINTLSILEMFYINWVKSG